MLINLADKMQKGDRVKSFRGVRIGHSCRERKSEEMHKGYIYTASEGVITVGVGIAFI